jgi:hypothetical protein
MFYFGLIQSKIQYALPCWGRANDNKILPILRLQKKVVRMMSKKPRLHESLPLFKNLNILPIKHLYCFKVLKIFYIRSGYQNYRHSTIYSLRVNTQRLVNIPNYRTATYENSYSISSGRLFNSLPNFIRNLRSKNKFLKQVKEWLSNLNYEEIEGLFVTVV